MIEGASDWREASDRGGKLFAGASDRGGIVIAGASDLRRVVVLCDCV